MKQSQAECAAKVVEVTPFVMRHLRAHVRSQREHTFTIPQFRVLAYLHHHGEATLSELALSQGVSLPTMSKLVGSLVQRKLVAREGHGEDRRKLKLRLSSDGEKAYETTLQNTREYVSSIVAKLSEAEQRKISESLDLLHALFEQSVPTQVP